MWHFTDRREFLGTALTMTAGISYDDLDEHRRGYLNMSAPTLAFSAAAPL